MDSFEEKHKMVQQLLNMLKSHASNEVDSGLQKPDGEDDMHGIQVEKVEVLPEHKMDEPTPEHDVVTHEMHTGGVVDKVSPTVPLTMDSQKGQPMKEGSAHEEATESESEREAEGDITPMFASLFGRKRKK